MKLRESGWLQKTQTQLMKASKLQKTQSKLKGLANYQITN